MPSVYFDSDFITARQHPECELNSSRDIAGRFMNINVQC